MYFCSKIQIINPSNTANLNHISFIVHRDKCIICILWPIYLFVTRDQPNPRLFGIRKYRFMACSAIQSVMHSFHLCIVGNCTRTLAIIILPQQQPVNIESHRNTELDAEKQIKATYSTPSREHFCYIISEITRPKANQWKSFFQFRFRRRGGKDFCHVICGIYDNNWLPNPSSCRQIVHSTRVIVYTIDFTFGKEKTIKVAHMYFCNMPQSVRHSVCLRQLRIMNWSCLWESHFSSCTIISVTLALTIIFGILREAIIKYKQLQSTQVRANNLAVNVNPSIETSTAHHHDDHDHLLLLFHAPKHDFPQTRRQSIEGRWSESVCHDDDHKGDSLSAFENAKSQWKTRIENSFIQPKRSSPVSFTKWQNYVKYSWLLSLFTASVRNNFVHNETLLMRDAAVCWLFRTW